jgi:hypothetical protein
MIGLLVIFILLTLTASNKAGGFEAIGIAFILIFVAPAILLFSIIVGIKRQSMKQASVSIENYAIFGIKVSRQFYVFLSIMLYLIIASMMLIIAIYRV